VTIKVHVKRAGIPIQYGEKLPGTDLVRQFQDGREIGPVYMGAEKHLGHALDKAEQQAEALGYRQFYRGGLLYVRLFGEWCELETTA
jgi:hypothetical protein